MPKDYGANRIKRSGTFLILLSMISLLLTLSGCGNQRRVNVVGHGGGLVRRGAARRGNGHSYRSVFRGRIITDANGNYGFGGLQTGTYTVTPSLAGYTFVPTSPGGLSLRE